MDKQDLFSEISEEVESMLGELEEYFFEYKIETDYIRELEEINCYGGHFEDKNANNINIDKFAKKFGYYDSASLFAELYENMEVKTKVIEPLSRYPQRGMFEFDSVNIGQEEHLVSDDTNLYGLLDSVKENTFDEIADYCNNWVRIEKRDNDYYLIVDYDKTVQFYVSYDDVLKYLNDKRVEIGLPKLELSFDDECYEKRAY